MINWIAKLINNQYKKRLEKIDKPVKKKIPTVNRNGFLRYDDFINYHSLHE